MNRWISRGTAVTGVALYLLFVVAPSALAGSIDDVIPDGPDYSNLGFISGPAGELTGNLLAIAQIVALFFLVLSLTFIAAAGDNKQPQWQRRAKISLIVLVIATIFNPLLTGGFGFIDGLFT